MKNKSRDNILQILENANGKYTSGQEISKILGVTRSAVWKSINLLREKGYIINSKTNVGYSLTSNNNKVNETNIRNNLQNYTNRKIQILDIVDSTNTYLRSEANNCYDRTVVISQYQTNGKGRYGKSFYSPENKGIYMSILVKPILDSNINLQNITMLTFIAGICVAKSIKQLYNIDVGIKWVNDIFYEKKKLCGILTEAVLNAEGGGIENAVIGIGINTERTNLPSEIENTAISLEDIVTSNIKVKKSVLISEILNCFDDIYDKFAMSGNTNNIINMYKSYSFVVGKDVTVIQGNNIYEAFVIDICDNGSLYVKTDSGEYKNLNSGEISIKV